MNFHKRRLLNWEICDINYHINYLKKQQYYIDIDLAKTNVPFELIQQFYIFSEFKFKKVFSKENERLKNKFNRLSDCNKFSLIDNDEIDSWFHNLTDVVIPDVVKETVALGPKFCSKSLTNKKDIVNTVKNVEWVLKKSELDQNEQRTIRQKIVSHISTVRTKMTHNSFFQRSFSNNLNITKEFLKNNSELMFTFSDKGNSTVCIKSSDYKEKMSELLDDKTTYKKLNSNPLEPLIKKTAKILHRLNDNDYLKHKHHHNAFTCTDTMLAKAYGLAKIHKQGVPLRPIISLTNTPTYKLASYLYNDLKNAIPLPKSHINNSFEFVSKIKGTTLTDDDLFISLDVVSLFTNVTCEQVIKSLEKRAHIIRKKCKIPFHEIIEITKFLFDNTVLCSIVNIINKLRAPQWVLLFPRFLQMLLWKIWNRNVYQY